LNLGYTTLTVGAEVGDFVGAGVIGPGVVGAGVVGTEVVGAEVAGAEVAGAEVVVGATEAMTGAAVGVSATGAAVGVPVIGAAVGSSVTNGVSVGESGLIGSTEGEVVDAIGAAVVGA
jgi:hypothetical protein